LFASGGIDYYYEAIFIRIYYVPCVYTDICIRFVDLKNHEKVLTNWKTSAFVMEPDLAHGPHLPSTKTKIQSNVLNQYRTSGIVRAPVLKYLKQNVPLLRIALFFCFFYIAALMKKFLIFHD